MLRKAIENSFVNLSEVARQRWFNLLNELFKKSEIPEEVKIDGRMKPEHFLETFNKLYRRFMIKHILYTSDFKISCYFSYNSELKKPNFIVKLEVNYKLSSYQPILRKMEKLLGLITTFKKRISFLKKMYEHEGLVTYKLPIGSVHVTVGIEYVEKEVYEYMKSVMFIIPLIDGNLKRPPMLYKLSPVIGLVVNEIVKTY